jgi:putative ABC transport system substrate-binding protein
MTGIGVDPVEAGLVTSMARPGGNVTGVAAFSPELWGKRLEIFKEAVPRLSRLAVLRNPANPGNAFCVKELQAVALAMGVQLQFLAVRDANAFEPAFAAIAGEAAQEEMAVALRIYAEAHKAHATRKPKAAEHMP